MDGIVKRIAVLLLALLGVAACGEPSAPEPAHAGKLVSYWINRLDEPDKRGGLEIIDRSFGSDDQLDAHPAVAALVAIGPDAVPFLESALSQGSERARSNAARTLGKIRPRSVEVVDALLSAARAPGSPMAWAATLALAEAGPDSPKVLAFLREVVATPKSPLRVAAIRAATELGPRASVLTPDLTAIIDEWVRAGSSTTPGPGFNDGREAIAACYALGMIGPEASSAGPALRDAFLSSDQPEFGWALGAVKAPEAEAVLVAELRSENESHHLGALWGVYELGYPVLGAVPQIAALLEDPDRVVRRGAARVLGSFGNAARDAVPALLEALLHPSSGTRGDAATALGKIGDRSAPVAEALRAARQDEVEWVRDEVEAALAALGSK